MGSRVLSIKGNLWERSRHAQQGPCALLNVAVTIRFGVLRLPGHGTSPRGQLTDSLRSGIVATTGLE